MHSSPPARRPFARFIQTAADATIRWRVEYDPYGTVFAYRTGAEKHQPLRFPGQENDGSTELTYNIFRWYRSGWGRYTQADPIDLDGGLNLYVYALGTPTMLIDRLGLDTAGCDDILGKLENPCQKECCAAHDACYDKANCSSGSWSFNKPKCGCDQTPECKKCNSEAVGCIAKCTTNFWAPGKKDVPNFYCGKLHKYVSIPKDFPSYQAAIDACKYDYSKDCTIPLKPEPKKIKKPWYKKLPGL